MCLCEVDHLEEKYSKLLIEMGYQYYTESRRGKDSILIAFKPKVFEYVEHYGILHDSLCEKFPALNGRANDFKRGNCSLYVTLKHIHSGKKL